MHELWRAGDLLMAMVAIATAAGFPPLGTGAFWGIVTLWGIITILFDDETPRGVPGMEHWQHRGNRDAGNR
jgi:hypothetical protein